jgi:hypothetical protein
MYDVIGIVVFMAIVVGLAAGILFLVDRLTLRSGLSEEERRSLVEKRTQRWQRVWSVFYLSCAVIALVVNVLNPGHEALGWRIGWCVVAALVVIRFLLPEQKTNGDDD